MIEGKARGKAGGVESARPRNGSQAPVARDKRGEQS